jgi:hypothetical protein
MDTSSLTIKWVIIKWVIEVSGRFFCTSVSPTSVSVGAAGVEQGMGRTSTHGNHPTDEQVV